MSDQLHLIAAPEWPTQKVDLLAGPRTQRWIFELIHARTNRYVRTITSEIRDFEVEFNVHADIRSGGTAVWQSRTPIDWMEHRLRVHLEVSSLGRSTRWTIGTFYVEAPQGPITAARASRTLQLYDMMFRLKTQMSTAAQWVAPRGANIIDTVRRLLDRQSMRHALADAPQTFSSQMSWEATTTYLKMTNDMLQAANHFSIWADPQAILRADPYRAPAQRGISWVFRDDRTEHPYLPGPMLTEDTYSVPSKVVLTASTDDPDALPMVGVAMDTTSRFSFERRDVRITHTEQNIDAADQQTLTALAARKLEELQRVSRTVEVQHLILPLALNDVARLEHTAAEFATTAVIEKFAFGMSSEGLCTTTIREVGA